MDIEGFVRVSNNSGEEYEDAQVRLVVGRINLVEKIAQLARVRLEDVSKLYTKGKRRLEERALKHAVEKAEDKDEVFSFFVGFADGKGGGRPKQVAKEGLSEYFIYTIEGTETIPNGWSKRLRSLEAANVPLKIQYRCRREYGYKLVRHVSARQRQGVETRLDAAAGRHRPRFPPQRPRRVELPRRPAGQVHPHRRQDRVEPRARPQRDFRTRQAAMPPRQHLDATPRGRNLQKVASPTWRSRPIIRWLAGTSERCIASGCELHPKPIDLEVRQPFSGNVVFRSGLSAKNYDYQTVEYTAAVKPGEKVDLLHEVIRRQGRNAKQNRVAIERSEKLP